MISETTNILFWNSRGLYPHLSTITAALLSSTITPQILIFTETHFQQDDHKTLQQQLPDYQCFSYPHTRSSGGIVILIHNSIAIDSSAHGLPEFGPSQTGDSSTLKWIRVRAPHRKSFIIGAVYLTPNTDITNIRLLHQSLDTAGLIDTPIFLVGDYNLHHSNWSNFATNRCSTQSQMFSAYVNNNGWSVLNADYLPHVPTRPNPSNHNTGTIIDLAVTNSDHLVQKLYVDEDWSNLLNSDHTPLILSINQSNHNNSHRPSQESYQLNRFRINDKPEWWQELFPTQIEIELKKSANNCNWLNIINNQLQQNVNMSKVRAQYYIDCASQTITDSIISAATRVIGTKPASTFSANHWFNSAEVKITYKKMKATSRLLNRVRKRQPDNFLKIQQITAAFSSSKLNWHKISSKAKDDNWRELCDRMQRNPSSKLIWSIFKRTRGSKARIKLNSVLDTMNELPCCNNNSLNNATQQLVDSAIPPPPMDPQIYNQLQQNVEQWSESQEHDESDNWTFTVDEITHQVHHQRTDSAPGPDTISALLLKHGGEKLVKALHLLYNFSWKYGVIPKQWTIANVALIPKSDSTNVNDASQSTRPISMTNTIIRTFEHLIHHKLVKRLENEQFLEGIRQFGFRQDHCCADAILQLHHHLFSTVNAGKIAPVAFLDLKKAFDRVDPNQLLSSVRQNANIKGKAFNWIHSFISNRYLRVVDRTQAASWHQMEFGVPQGAVLSPLLFLIFIQSVAKRINNKFNDKVKMLLYADDLVIFPDIGKCKSRWYKIFQETLDELTKWSTEYRMQFNPDKSKIIMFHRKHKMPVNCYYTPLTLCNFNMEFVTEYKYLGIWFQSNLCWSHQSKQAMTAARRAAGLICRTMKKNSAPYYTAIRTMAISFLRAIATYGMEFWSPSERTIRSIQSSLARPLRASLNLPITTHQLGVLVETGIPSIKVYREQRQIGFLNRAIHQLPPNHHTTKLIKPFVNNELLALKSMRNYGNSIKSRPFWICQALDAFCRWFNGENPTTIKPRKQIKTTALERTRDEWLNDPKHPTTAPLRIIKQQPFESEYLRVDPPATLSLRSRLRANRALTQQVCYRFKLNNVPSPNCTNYSCTNLEDSVHHMLLECPRHNTARMQLLRLFPQFSSGDGRLFGLLLGEKMSHDANLSISNRKYHQWMKQSGNFLHQLVVDRLGLPGLIGRV